MDLNFCLPGRPPKISNQRAKRELKRLVNNKADVSQGKIASRFQCTQKYVNKVIKGIGVKKYKKQKIPDQTDEQKAVNRP